MLQKKKRSKNCLLFFFQILLFEAKKIFFKYSYLKQKNFCLKRLKLKLLYEAKKARNTVDYKTVFLFLFLAHKSPGV